MANDIATGATWQINCSARAGGNKRIRRMVSAAVSDESSVEAVPEVGPGEMVGFTDTPGATNISFEMRETKGVRAEIDWHYLKASKEVFSLTRQVIGGRRRQFPECRVSSVSDNDTDQGEITYTVELVTLGGRAM